MNLCLVVLLFAATITTANAKNMRKMTKEKEENISPNLALVRSKNRERKMEDVPQMQQGKAGIIPLVELSLEFLKIVLDAMGRVERKISVGIGNDSGVKWQAINVYFLSGTSDVILPSHVYDQEASTYTARKTKGSLRGAVGVISYYIPIEDRSLCVMFSVPYDYNLYSNWWNAKIYQGRKTADKDTYNDLYYEQNPFPGNDAWNFYKPIGFGYTIEEGYMGSSGTTMLEIKITKT